MEKDMLKNSNSKLISYYR